MAKQLVNQSEASFLAGNSLTSYFHLKSKPTMPVIINTHETCSTEFEQIARQLEFKHQSQIFKLLPMNYD